MGTSKKHSLQLIMSKRISAEIACLQTHLHLLLKKGLYAATLSMDQTIYNDFSMHKTTIENRRMEVADPVTGLGIGFSHFHHPMTQKKFIIFNPDRKESDRSTQKPFDIPAMRIYAPPKVAPGVRSQVAARRGLRLPFTVYFFECFAKKS
jgi:hypothetical protein